MSALQPILMIGAGYIAAEMIASKLMPNTTGVKRGAILGLGGAALAVFMPSVAPVALGIGANGVVGIGRDVLKLNTGVAGLAGMDDADMRVLEAMAGITDVSQMVNGDADGMVNGDADGMVNGDFDY